MDRTIVDSFIEELVADIVERTDNLTKTYLVKVMKARWEAQGYTFRPNNNHNEIRLCQRLSEEINRRSRGRRYEIRIVHRSPVYVSIVAQIVKPEDQPDHTLQKAS